MIKAFEELAYSRTPMGELTLRRRRLSTQETYFYEIKLGDDFLMSSLFTEGETALAELSLQALVSDRLDVAVGGLGLGYTAASVLRNPRVQSLCVIERGSQASARPRAARDLPSGRQYTAGNLWSS